MAQAVFLLERGQTDRQTNKQADATERPTHAGVYAGVGNEFSDINAIHQAKYPPHDIHAYWCCFTYDKLFTKLHMVVVVHCCTG